MSSEMTAETHSDDELEILTTPVPVVKAPPPPPPRRTVQATLDLFVTAVPSDTPSQDSQTPNTSQMTVWTDKDVLRERKRLLLHPPKPEPPRPAPRPETTLPGLVSMLPRTVVNELLTTCVENGELLSEQQLRDVLVSLRSTNLGKLPDEILVNIFSFLPLKDKLTCILMLCTRFRPIIAERELWRNVSMLKKDTHVEGRSVKWIKGPGAVRLICKVIPTNTIQVFSVFSDSLSRTQLLKCVKAHAQTIKELNFTGANFAGRGRFNDFPVLEKLEKLRIATTHDGDTQYGMPDSLCTWLPKLPNMTELIMDFSVTPLMNLAVVNDAASNAMLHKTLSVLHLGRIHFTAFFDLVQACTALKELSIQDMDFGLVNMEWRIDTDQEVGLDYAVPLLVEEKATALRESKKRKDGVAKLVSLACGWEISRNDKLPVVVLQTFSEAIGDHLEHLVLRNVRKPLRGNFPVLKSIRMFRNSSIPEDALKSAREEFRGLYAPKLTTLEYRRSGYEKNGDPAWDAQVDRETQYWEEAQKILGNKVKVDKKKWASDSWKNPFSQMWRDVYH